MAIGEVLSKVAFFGTESVIVISDPDLFFNLLADFFNYNLKCPIHPLVWAFLKSGLAEMLP